MSKQAMKAIDLIRGGYNVDIPIAAANGGFFGVRKSLVARITIGKSLSAVYVVKDRGGETTFTKAEHAAMAYDEIA